MVRPADAGLLEELADTRRQAYPEALASMSKNGCLLHPLHSQLLYELPQADMISNGLAKC